MASDNVSEAKGRDLCKQAEKKLTEWSLFNKKGKFEEAAELYSKAAAQFKIAKNWEEAGNAYVKAAEYAEKSDNEPEAVNYYTQAGKAFKTVSAEDAIRMFEICVNKHQENNKFGQAAKLLKEMAEIWENEMKVSKAMECYQKAADAFFAEDSTTSGNQCLLKVADFAAQQEDYKRAIQIYERVANQSLDNNLTKWSVTEYLFKAALCSFALDAKSHDVDATKIALQRYTDLHPPFETAREYTLMTKLLDAFQEHDIQRFTDELYDYNQTYPLDAWKSSILLTVKNVLKAAEEPAGEAVPDWK